MARRRARGYVTSMATVFSDRLFSAGLSCSRVSLKAEEEQARQKLSRQEVSPPVILTVAKQPQQQTNPTSHLGTMSSGEAEAVATLGF